MEGNRLMVPCFADGISASDGIKWMLMGNGNKDNGCCNVFAFGIVCSLLIKYFGANIVSRWLVLISAIIVLVKEDPSIIWEIAHRTLLASSYLQIWAILDNAL
eukprot:1470714-Ditylum_brightwellii.AAC.1